jgi:hypothetical protein
MIGSLWTFTMLFLYEIRPAITARSYWIRQILFQGPILTYALLFFLDLPIKEAAQKIAIVGLYVALLSASTKAAKPAGRETDETRVGNRGDLGWDTQRAQK